MGLGLMAGPSFAFDPTAPDPSVACCDATANEAFREGARAYFAGNTAEAVDGLREAAESGHPAAQWKLGRMYASGDGVPEDDLKAFEYFSHIIEEHGAEQPTSAQAPYIANAFVELGNYYRLGIANSTIRANPEQALEIYTYAASYYGDAEAQNQLGMMYLDGNGVERDPRQAARWFLLAARKGQVDAQFHLGRMLLTGTEIEANPVHGLMWLTVALKQVGGRDSGSDIRSAHEEAFALANENTRRQASELAAEWMADNSAALASIEPQ